MIIVDVLASTEAFVGNERRTAIRQTVPTKASVEAKTSTIINKKLFFNEFHFEIEDCCPSLWLNLKVEETTCSRSNSEENSINSTSCSVEYVQRGSSLKSQLAVCSRLVVSEKTVKVQRVMVDSCFESTV